jgi:hypothetical protein
VGRQPGKESGDRHEESPPKSPGRELAAASCLIGSRSPESEDSRGLFDRDRRLTGELIEPRLRSLLHVGTS